ncbi:Uncharacterized protein FWK35_00017709, partial [Aphis craccivora]
IHKTTNLPPYISNPKLHTDLILQTVHKEAVTFYQRFHFKLSSHINHLVALYLTHHFQNSKESPKKTQKELVSSPD